MKNFIRIIKGNDRTQISVIGIPVFYKREDLYEIRIRILCFRFTLSKNKQDIKIQKLEERIKKIEKTYSILNKKEIQKDDQQPFGDIRKGSILMIETNNYHGDTMPGMARYFVDLGYYVDILLSPKEFDINPFSRYKYKKIRIFRSDLSQTKTILENKIVEKYDYIYFNSDRVNFSRDYSYRYFKSKYLTNEKCLYMLHHPEDFRTLEGKKCFTLWEFENFKGVDAIFPAYFGEFQIKNSRLQTKFVVIGNIDRSRKDFTLLLTGVTSLLKQKINDFHISVIARKGDIEIPKALVQHISFKGSLSYPEMYKEIDDADYILPLLNSDIEDHLRYVTQGISGTIILSYAFRRPCVIENTFAKFYQMNERNSIIYKDSNCFEEALKKAIHTNFETYTDMQSNLSETYFSLYKKSIINLSKQITNIRK